MSVPPEDTLADPEQLTADLQPRLAECEVECYEAQQREIGTAEGLQVIIPRPATSRQYSRSASARQALGNDKGCL